MSVATIFDLCKLTINASSFADRLWALDLGRLDIEEFSATCRFQRSESAIVQASPKAKGASPPGLAPDVILFGLSL